MDNKLIYVFGHKNPDTDSVCAAISFSYLKNKLGFNTVPAVLGEVNKETKYALDYFKFKVPYHLNDVKTQIKDLNYHKNCFIDKNSTIKDAFDYMSKYYLNGVSVVENKNKYFGYISLKEIASEVINGNFHNIDTSYGNIVNILKGKKVLKYDKEIKAEVLETDYKLKDDLSNNIVLITDENMDDINYVIEKNTKLIILVSSIKLNNKYMTMAKKRNINVISTPYNSYEVGKLISLSNYIKYFVKSKEDTYIFSDVDYLSDFLDKSRKLKHTNYPIVNNKNECLGLLTLTDTNQINKKKVILVDHNNMSQSVDGLDEADILEVIDHHNIGDIVTKKPINFRNSSCGSVCTMIYEMYIENKIVIPKNIGGILLSAILSDTLLLTSPTTTSRDIDAAKKLAKIAKVNYKKYGIDMLKQGMSINNLKNEELLYKDFKTYRVDDDLIGIGQLLVSDIDDIKKRFNELVDFLDEVSKKDNYKVLTLFITDFFENKSYCLYNKDAEDIIKYSFNLSNVYEGVVFNGVLSRKVQIVPYIMNCLEK